MFMGTLSLVALLQHQLLWGMGVWGYNGYRGSKDQQRKGLQRQAMKVEVKKLTTHLFWLHR